MIRLPAHELQREALEELAELQREVDGLPDYKNRVSEVSKLWGARRGRKVFDVVTETLQRMCSGSERCMFCEDNSGHQIEHFRPKSLYPSLVFAWENFLFACGVCNPLKGNKFPIFIKDGHEVAEPGGSEIEPERGPPVLIDPRLEDPMSYLWLDLKTFCFVAHPDFSKGSREHRRANCTIDVLGLNKRPVLVEAREGAYETYVDWITGYVKEWKEAKEKNQDGDSGLKRRRCSALRRKGHVTVWREMKRQRDKHKQLQELVELLEQFPEILDW